MMMTFVSKVEILKTNRRIIREMICELMQNEFEDVFVSLRVGGICEKLFAVERSLGAIIEFIEGSDKDKND